jgi:hypothetical protein
MNANPEFASFARLMDSLAPWLEQLVIIGGWAHRLHRFHPLAQDLDYEALVTLDADVALPNRLQVRGAAIYERLTANGFEAELLGHHRPPATHYKLADPGIRFYAEFLTPLLGGAIKRGGRRQATARIGGITSQNLRYIEVLLASPWSVTLLQDDGFPLAREIQVPVSNPVGFIAQKILIHGRRNRAERAKDIMYIHDTLETFAPRIAELRREWTENIKPVLQANSVRTVERANETLFREVTDSIRAAVRIAEGRILTPEAVRQTCHVGLGQIFRPLN